MVNLKIETQVYDQKRMFYRNLLAGHFHKDLIRVILEESGYEVYPYGYESFLTPLKIKFEKGKIQPTEIAKKIRSTPDLLVYDNENEIAELLEVKSRRWDWTEDVSIDALPRYKKYWNESILVMVLPAGHFFYAQRVSDLESEIGEFDLNKTFAWFEELFTKVDLRTLCSYKKQIIDFWARQTKRYDPLSGGDRFNLWELTKQKKKWDIDELFHEQNKRNLISKRAFRKAIDTLIDEGKVIEKRGKIRLID